MTGVSLDFAQYEEFAEMRQVNFSMDLIFVYGQFDDKLSCLDILLTDDIELRICTSERYPDESTPVDVLELYVR